MDEADAVAEVVEHMHDLLDGDLDAETRLRLEGGILALDAVYTLLVEMAEDEADHGPERADLSNAERDVFSSIVARMVTT